MRIFESSDYVNEKATQLAGILKKEQNWFVIAGKSNCILINIPGVNKIIPTRKALAQILAIAYVNCKPSGLKRSVITYMFFHNLNLVCKIKVSPGSNYDNGEH